jgi:hypothetical protein
MVNRHSPTFKVDTLSLQGTEMAEKLTYTVAEVAALTGFCPKTVTRMFQDEPGVIVLDRPETMHKRRYRSIRIPRPVYERVINRLIV